MITQATQIDTAYNVIGGMPSNRRALTSVVTKAREATANNQQQIAIHLYEQALVACESIEEFDVLLTCEIIEELSEIYHNEGNVNEAAFLRETAEKLLGS